MLFPAISLYWKKYQKDMMSHAAKKSAVIAGDGRYDSMGHSPKCCGHGVPRQLLLGMGNSDFSKISFPLDHIVDKRQNLENSIFSKCAHEEIVPRAWLDERA